MGPTPHPLHPKNRAQKRKQKRKSIRSRTFCIAANLRLAPHACAADSLRLHRRSPHAAPPLPSARSSPAPPSPPLLTSRHACPPQPQPTSRVPDPVNPSLCLALAASLAGSPLSGRRRSVAVWSPSSRIALASPPHLAVDYPQSGRRRSLDILCPPRLLCPLRKLIRITSPLLLLCKTNVNLC